MVGIMKTVQRALNGKGGFSLLEIMLALSILAVGLLSLEGMFVSSIGATSRGMRTTQAVTLAEQKLEEFKGADYANVLNGEYEN
jgi:type IV pilus assembly protein PilV